MPDPHRQAGSKLMASSWRKVCAASPPARHRRLCHLLDPTPLFSLFYPAARNLPPAFQYDMWLPARRFLSLSLSPATSPLLALSLEYALLPPSPV